MTVAAAHRSPSPLASLPALASRTTMRAKASVTRTVRALRHRAPSIRAAVLQVGGLAGFTATAWAAHPIAGGAVGSTALFVLNWLLTGDNRRDGPR